jgi:hypothetical protein
MAREYPYLNAQFGRNRRRQMLVREITNNHSPMTLPKSYSASTVTASAADGFRNTSTVFLALLWISSEQR